VTITWQCSVSCVHFQTETLPIFPTDMIKRIPTTPLLSLLLPVPVLDLRCLLHTPPPDPILGVGFLCNLMIFRSGRPPTYAVHYTFSHMLPV